MSDDLVQRLRETRTDWACCQRAREAADRIEELEDKLEINRKLTQRSISRETRLEVALREIAECGFGGHKAIEMVQGIARRALEKE